MSTLRTVLLFLIVFLMVACQSNGHEVKDEEVINELEDVESVEEEDDEMEIEVVTNAQVPEWSKDAVIYEVNFRQYTEEGTFKAFKNHLPRLQELGVDILWFMPIHPISEENRLGTLGSYYAVSDYRGINPEFGTMEDFQDLVDTAQDMGFYVILDWVANHTGWDHSWIKENPDWYQQNSEGEITNPQEFNWTDVAQLNFENEEMRHEMKEAMKFWVKETGVDGFRADYANGVPLDFWEEISSELSEIKEVFMLAEDDKIMNLLNEAFLVNWGWRFYHLIDDISNEKRGANAIESYSKWVETMYPKGSYPMNFITNHDENSWHGTIDERLGNSSEAMAALYFTIPGVPLIYSGQEAGDKKSLEFFEKDEIDWSDLSAQTHYSELIQLKKDNKALWNGDAGGEITFLETTDDKLLAFKREKEGNQVLVIMNLSSDETEATVNFGFEGDYKSFQSKESVTLSNEEIYQLEPWDYRILYNHK